MSVEIIPIRKLRPRLSEVIKNVNDGFDRYIVTKRGHPTAVIMSIDDYESLLETVEIHSDKTLMRRLNKAEKEIESSGGRSLDDIKKALEFV